MTLKLGVRRNEETGLYEVYSLEAPERPARYLGLNNRKLFVVGTEDEAESFLRENGGGRLYIFVYHKHKDETLPESKFLREVAGAS